MEIAEPRWYDYAVLGWLALPTPLIAIWGHRHLRRMLAAGRADARRRIYRQTIAIEWLAAIALVALWLGAGRSPGELGLGAGSAGWRLWTGAGLVAAATAFQLWQMTSVRRSERLRRQVLERLEHVAAVLPRDRGERDFFMVLSLTAGVCEEIVYRGYLIWLLAALGGLWLAVPGSAVLFALAHLYQGPRSIGGILAVGLVAAGLYLLTGALWVPMLLHAVIDLTSGLLAYDALEAPPGGPPPAVAAGGA